LRAKVKIRRRTGKKRSLRNNMGPAASPEHSNPYSTHTHTHTHGAVYVYIYPSSRFGSGWWRENEGAKKKMVMKNKTKKKKRAAI
jgi:hypothetical protein